MDDLSTLWGGVVGDIAHLDHTILCDCQGPKVVRWSRVVHAGSITTHKKAPQSARRMATQATAFVAAARRSQSRCFQRRGHIHVSLLLHYMIRPLPGRRPALYMYIKPPLTVLDPTFLSLILYVLLWCCFVKVPYGLLDMDAGMDRCLEPAV